MGSKNFIASKIISALPSAEVFVDLFAGGCAVTHAAMLSGKYKKVIANDIEGNGIRLFVNAIQGKYHDEKRWISREEFYLLKDIDPYVRLCWSFGNNGSDYLYSHDVEPYKKALHAMCFAKTPFDRAKAYKEVVHKLEGVIEKSSKDISKGINNLERLESLERLQRLEMMQCLELPDLQTSFLDYREVHIPENAVVYCDIPYKDKTTKGYGGGQFDHDEFYAWAKNKSGIFISEYAMPEDFVDVYTINHASRIAANKSFSIVERIFVPAFSKASITKQLELHGSVNV